MIVRNISPNPGGSSDPEQLTAIGNTLFFTANVGETGRMLWRSDGTESGTVLVEDIWRFTQSSNPLYPTHYGLIIAFSANDGLSGRELWMSPLGLGALLIKDINTLFGFPELSSDPEFLTVSGDVFFFAATASDGSARKLWKSNGTEVGTVMVRNINIPRSINPEKLTSINETLYFSADDGINGRELWMSDGTTGGTIMVEDINPSGNSDPNHLININNKLFFVADDGSNGRELWACGEAEFPWLLFYPAFTKPNYPVKLKKDIFRVASETSELTGDDKFVV